MVTPILTLLFVLSSLSAIAVGGYDFLKGKSSTTIHFEMFRNLIVIPATINDSVKVKLILDTGTRSMLLYGKRFASMPNLTGSRHVKVAGWGSPLGVDAHVSYPNNIILGNIKGEALGVAVIPTRKLFDDVPGIDGIIGYELFIKFVVEINYKARTIRLFGKLPYGHAEGFTCIPLDINKTMPQVQSSIVLNDKSTVNLQLLIDTGSSLGLTVFSKEKFKNYCGAVEHTVGMGLNGAVKGFDLYLNHFILGTLKVKSVSSCLVNVEEHPDDSFTYCGSVGAAFLKKHIVIFDYPSSKLFLKSSRQRNG
ncbi:MAG: aspartyl protease family protein [Bacteroidota bacterium]